ncbi:MAG: endonuclease/exonuclease/phosphatase family protein [Bosea sp. (in: a-proteobacteria)]|uniref:endonuclease/exonuclease/phosphatase family protein n=1 Tax=Bosea sp. (in: a-proteobacteria) TaxID=1871050 RepID=UPI0027373E97|nr:endonuclease/exonuclease/phosphatase family protein [Bosea sp. (in: a-proteobacteria)]MDP3257432.1 endonuclease/exonuclease/phosphatase family protein [Bosea sp. (in: a-proteobacteria)]MDP3319400.1 endonuclease/exonuclease/phosphatase family protein [Bosea sp. (in: a-proteobacteria)]
MKLITWNIQWARGTDDRVDPRRIVDHAKAMADFDVLCLQEVAANFPDLDGNDDTDQFALFADMLPGFTAIEGIGVDVDDGRGGRKRFGNLILTRYRVAQALRHLLPWEAAATRNMPRVLVEAVAETPLGPVRLMTTHLEYSSPVLRAAQVEGIREAHRMAASRARTPRAPGPHTYAPTPNTASAILTGDFNMRPDDPALARLMAPFDDGTPLLRDLWPVLMGDASPPPTAFIVDQTYGPPGCLDYVLATPDLAARARSILCDVDTRASDHQPIMVEFDAG